ncbi:unnamed protein product [Ceratitis capitata]|uniref:Mannosyltransferase n=1 Tax=Ceratitis capitata TaxID=7213 RepID=A0A811U463_CERCA|nr:unnamed protein product [Ceratitis capitata]
MHDILYLRQNFTQYDHHDFPGVVPRTFIGPLVISILSSPFVILFETLNMHKFWAQYVVRLILAAVVTTSWHKLRHVITRQLGTEVRLWFTIITLTQFHFIFYMSRPLPNIMALPVVLYALAFWLQGQTKPFIITSGIAILVFRSELLIFLGLLLAYDVIFRKVSISSVLKIALPAVFLLVVSSTNYPGGVALTRLHRLEADAVNVSVHIANLAAQSGVSRFLQIRDDWHYCKNESVTYDPDMTQHYTHLLVEAKNKNNLQLWSNLQEEFETLDFVDCFNNIGIQYSSLVPVRIKTKPCIGILKRRKPPTDVKSKKKTNDEKKSKNKKKSIEKRAIDNSLIVEDEVPKDLPSEEKTISKALEDPLELVKNVESIQNDMFDPKASIEDGYVEDWTLEAMDEDEFEKPVEAQQTRAQPTFSSKATEDSDITAQEPIDASNQMDDISDQPSKDINFQELHNLALGKVNRKTLATRRKIRQLIEQHYRSKGRQVENSAEKIDKRPATGQRQTVKAIIKQERIKEMIEQIATMDLTRICDLEHVSTKDCLKQVIDRLDADEKISSNA